MRNNNGPSRRSSCIVFLWMAIATSMLLHGCATPVITPAAAPSPANPQKQDVLAVSDAENMQQAIINGDLATVQRLIAQGVSADIRDSSGVSPLYAASAYDRVDIAKFLLARGADINTRLPNGATLLHAASQNGQTAMVRFLLDHQLDPNLARKDGWTALHRAAERGFVEMAQDLLEAGAHIDPREQRGATPLFLAAQNGHTRIVDLLIARGADVNAKTGEGTGTTPLHNAAALGHIDVVQRLIDRGAAVNVEQNDGATPLLLAVQQNHFEVARFLLENGADPQSSSKKGLTPLHAAAHANNPDSAAMLLKYGAKVDATADGIGTPLHIAAFFGNATLLNLLLSHGVNPTIRAAQAGTPADLALASGHWQSAAVLRNASGSKISERPTFLPDNITSRYLITKSTGFSFNMDNGKLQTNVLLVVVPVVALVEKTYFTAKLIAPDRDTVATVEKTALTLDPKNEINFEFKNAGGVRCGLYRLEVAFYKDPQKERLIGLHQQGIMSVVNTNNIANVGEIISKGRMETCQ